MLKHIHWLMAAPLMCTAATAYAQGTPAPKGKTPAAPPMEAAKPGEYPNKPVRFMVPFAAGGSTDLVARMVGQKMSEALGNMNIEGKGKLKITPFGDQTISGNGVTYTPNLTPVYEITDEDFIGDKSADPVIVTRAAQAIHLSQPAITQALAKLAERFGTELLRFGPDGAAPTEAGRLLHDRVVRALALIESGAREAVRLDQRRSGGGFARCAATALIENTTLSAREITEKSMELAGKLCIYTNENVIFEELG